MSKLSQEIRKRIEALGLTQKDIAVAFHDEHAKRARKPLSFETLEPKLSKLLGGEREGEAFFFQDEHRIGALALALKMEAEVLHGLRGIRTLVLDPTLPQAACAYLVDRECDAGARHHCVQVEVDGVDLAAVTVDDPAAGARARQYLSTSDAGRVRDALREQARAHAGCMVVLAATSDVSFFEGASIATTETRKHPRGYLLVQAPDLVPLPPPAPPALFDGDGTPMIPHDEFTEVVRLRLTEERGRQAGWGSGPMPDSDPMGRLERAAAAGSTPTFRVEEIGPWLTRADGPEEAIRWTPRRSARWHNDRGRDEQELAERCFDALADPTAPTVCWTHGRRVFAVGRAASRVAELFAPHHEVVSPQSFDDWRTHLETWNPWVVRWEGAPDAKRPPRWVDFCTKVVADCGVDPGQVLDRWLHQVAARADQGALQIEAASSEAISSTRTALRALAARAFNLAPSDAHVPFVLEVAAEAPLRVLPHRKSEVHAIVSLGAGHMVRVRATCFAGEEPVPVHRLEKGFDGGDVHLWLEPLPDDRLLEGFVLPSVARRRAAADDDD